MKWKFSDKGVIPDISKAFDKVWHEDILFKLNENGLTSNNLSTLGNFLRDSKSGKAWTTPGKCISATLLVLRYWVFPITVECYQKKNEMSRLEILKTLQVLMDFQIMKQGMLAENNCENTRMQ